MAHPEASGGIRRHPEASGGSLLAVDLLRHLSRRPHHHPRCDKKWREVWGTGWGSCGTTPPLVWEAPPPAV